MRRIQRRSGRNAPAITLLGFLFSVATALIGLAAFVSADDLLFLLLAALLATFLIPAYQPAGACRIGNRSAVPEQIAAEREFLAQACPEERKAWVPSFSITFSGAPESG